MFGKGSPKLNMMRRVSPKLSLMSTSISKRKRSPKCSQAKKIGGGSPRGMLFFIFFMVFHYWFFVIPYNGSKWFIIAYVAKSRAYWSRALDKSLVDILLEHKNNGDRADNGWSADVWSKMYAEFLGRNKSVTFTKTQVQDRERELKRDYRLLKDAKRESGCSWSYEKQMLEADSHQLDNLVIVSIINIIS